MLSRSYNSGKSDDGKGNGKVRTWKPRAYPDSKHKALSDPEAELAKLLLPLDAEVDTSTRKPLAKPGSKPKAQSDPDAEYAELLRFLEADLDLATRWDLQNRAQALVFE